MRQQYIFKLQYRELTLMTNKPIKILIILSLIPLNTLYSNHVMAKKKSPPVLMWADNKNYTYHLSADAACESSISKITWILSATYEFKEGFGHGCFQIFADNAPGGTESTWAQNWATPILGCKEGYTYSSHTDACESAGSHNGSKCTVGNPIEIANGVKVESTIDFTLSNKNHPLHITRNYSSRIHSIPRPLGVGWYLDPYHYSASFNLSLGSILLKRGMSEQWLFNQIDDSTIYQAEFAPHLLIESLDDGSFKFVGGQYDEEVYDTHGRLISIKMDENQHFLYYSDEGLFSSEIKYSPLKSITDKFGNTFKIIYNEEGYISGVQFQDKTIINYIVD